MRAIIALRSIGSSLALANVPEDIANKTAEEMSIRMYPSNKHRRSWAFDNIMLFYDNEIAHIKILSGESENEVNRTIWSG